MSTLNALLESSVLTIARSKPAFKLRSDDDAMVCPVLSTQTIFCLRATVLHRRSSREALKKQRQEAL